MTIWSKILLATSVAGFALPAALLAASAADAAQQQLRDGNTRFVTAAADHPRQDAARRADVVQGQAPFATILACSDSRVPVELLFDQGIGDVFVTRVAGNVADTDEIGTIEYGVGHLHTPLLVVLGHTGCGAVTAVFEGAEVHGSIPALVDNIAPAVAQARAAHAGAPHAEILSEAVKLNVWTSIDSLFQHSEEVRTLVSEGKLQVVGAIYDLATGAVAWLGQHPEQARLLATTGETGSASAEAHGAATATHADAGTAAVHPTVAGGHDAATTTTLEPRILRWVAGTLVTVLAAMAASWAFARSALKRWKVPQRLAVGFATILLVLIVAGGAGYEGLHSALGGFREFRTDADHTELAAEIDSQVKSMIIAAKDYEITRAAHDIADYQKEHDTFGGLLARAEQEIHEPARLELLRSLREHMNSHATLFQQLTKARNAADRAHLGQQLVVPGNEANQEIDRLLADIAAEQDRDGPIIARNLQEAQAAIVSIALGAIVLGIYLGWLISTSIVAPLRELTQTLAAGAAQTSAAAGQVSAASQTLAEGASEQAASLEETSSSIEELASMTKRNADNAVQAKAVASETRLSADAGANRMSTMVTAMDAIRGASQDITKILKTIDEIAFQTNILALNAAVEAARAGEAGAGFAVVADEVRSLAQRCAAAAKETAVKIEDSVAKSHQGVQISAEVAQSFSTIQDGIRQLDTLVAGIATASQEQSQGIGQINTAVTQMDQITQSNAGSAEESAGASEELNSQAVALREAVDRLEQLVGGGARHDPVAVTAAAPAPAALRRPTLAPPASRRAPAKAPARAAVAAAPDEAGDHFR